MGLTTHAKTRKRWLVDAILSFGVFARAYNFNLTQHTQIMWKFWPQDCCANKYALKKKLTTAVVDNNPSSTTANDSFHCTRVSLAWQAKNEDEIWMLAEFVHRSTGKYGACACWLHTFFQCPAHHQNSLCLCWKGTAVQSSQRDKLWQGKRRPRGLYIHSTGNSNHHK